MQITRMIAYICLLLLISLCSAESVKYNDCATHEIKSLLISQCNGEESCVLHKGNDLNIEVQFTANQNSRSAEIQLLAKMGELEVQVPGLDTDACNGHLTCPLVMGQTYTLKYSVFIPKLVPTLMASVTAKLVGEHGVLACGKVNGSIED